MQSNQLTGGVPSTLGKLTSLTQLDISNNFIGTFPPTLCKLASLASARIAGNNITNPAVFDPWLCANLTKLTYVDISNNPLGSLPMSLQNLPNLQQLCVPPSLLLLPRSSRPAGVVARVPCPILAIRCVIARRYAQNISMSQLFTGGPGPPCLPNIQQLCVRPSAHPS